MKKFDKQKEEKSLFITGKEDRTKSGETLPGGIGRTMGSATKDGRHGIHTDHGASRRTESRRGGSQGSESKSKSARKNI